MRLTGGEIVGDWLIREGVPYVAGIPGHGNIMLVDALRDRRDKLGFIQTRSEHGAVHLADGHYLKLGLGLQAVADVAHAPDGAKALDAAISLYSGREMSELADPVRRDELKAELKHKVEEKYHHDVVDVYFTEYVMQ